MIATEDEPAFLARGGDVARETQAFVGMAYLLLDGRGRVENKLSLLTPAGEVAWDYLKSHPVPGSETMAPGPGRVPSLATEHGRLAGVICFDADFPQLLRQAGQAGADVLLVPADDWPEIDPLHSQMAALRAIELGASMLRPTTGGLSLAVDPYGRTLGAIDAPRSGERVLVAHLPARGVRTPYSALGDVLAWACVVILAVLLIRARRPC